MKYTKELVKKICELIAADDYTIAEVCEQSGISRETFNVWKNTKPDFSDSIKKAEERRLETFKKAARSGLLILLQGKQWEEVTTEYVEDKEDPKKPKIKFKRKVTKFILPNPTSVIFAMKNLDSEYFKDKIETKNENTNYNYNSVPLTPEEIKQFSKALEDEC
jgi:hypothetical protein